MSSPHPFPHAPGQPQSKAAPTAQLTVPGKVPSDDEGAAKPIEHVRKRPAKPTKESVSSDSTALPATVNLIQKVLAPDKVIRNEATLDTTVIGDILPPLTTSSDVDVELYAILAIVVKDFVNTWYTRITPDHAFIAEIIQIVAHCCRALEQRIRKVDIPALCLDEIPSLVQNHINTYRFAASHSTSSPYGQSLRHLYHDLVPHPALSPLPFALEPFTVRHQAENERDYRQLLVQGVLAILLPTDDLQNGPLRRLVGDIIADLIIGQAVAGKVCEGWFLHDAISKVTAILGDKVHPKASGSEIRDDAENRLEKFGLLSHDSKFQHGHSSTRDQSQLVVWFWRLMQYGYLVYLFLVYVLKEIQFVRRKPKRQYHVGTPSSASILAEKSHMPSASHRDPLPRPVLAYGLYGMVSTLLQLADRMPWMTGMLSFWQEILLHRAGRIGHSNSILDRFLYHTIETHVVPPSLLPIVLRNLRATLFPKNSMGPPAPPPPSPEERLMIRRRTADSILNLMPAFVARTFYSVSNEDEIVSTIEDDILHPLDDEYLNKHLVYSILELVLVRLMPELGAQPISALLAERGVIWAEVSIPEEPELASSYVSNEQL